MSEDLVENADEENDVNYYNNKCEIDGEQEYALSSLSQEEQVCLLP